MSKSVFWFRRDLRLDDNTALCEALEASESVQCVFIFDVDILDTLDPKDARVHFIYDSLLKLNKQLAKYNSSIFVLHNSPLAAWKTIINTLDFDTVYTNEDYEPYAIKRDVEIAELLKTNSKLFKSFKDQVVFAKNEILKPNSTPYTIYTPYKNKWLEKFKQDPIQPKSPSKFSFAHSKYSLPSLQEIGFISTKSSVSGFNEQVLDSYHETRNFPSVSTSRIGPHLRFGTISVRKLILEHAIKNEVYLSELIWREFFMQILYHFPRVVNENFKLQYNRVNWRNNEEEFELWCQGKTGYPMVDAGMIELNKTGFMHNRVRMVVASFLCKHLLIDWRWGEAYFATKLLDYELASNNGNWQWASGTGCDAAPYFRIFNPTEQLKKFDPKLSYVKKWIPNFQIDQYIKPMVDHKMARLRALEAYKP